MDVPLVLAGDVFDRWNPSPELINLALEALEPVDVYAIPGQHDLPYHNYSDRKRSAYWTLVTARVVVNLTPGHGFFVADGHLVLYGFPWGWKLTRCPAQTNDPLTLAVCHRYCWIEGNSHPGAKPEDHVDALRKELAGFDAAVFGDNHSGFLASRRTGEAAVLNSGTVMRRTTAEAGYNPAYGVLYSNGCFARVQSTTPAKDRFREGNPLETVAGLSPDLVALIEDLPDQMSDQAAGLRDFRHELMRRLKGLSPDTRREVLDAVGEGDRADVR